MSLRIAIFDDEASTKRAWCDRLQRLELGEVLSLDNFPKEVGHLEQRRRGAREKQGVQSLAELDIESIFDGIDILIVDYDLLQATELTGEEIAYLLRCYSTCGIIVALNQFDMKGFDLTLAGHPESFADLNVGSHFLDSRGLWGETDWSEFRPWNWPILPDLKASFEQRIDDVEGNLSEPILPFLNLDTNSAGILPRVVQEFIQGHGRTPDETTFEDFICKSGQGLKRKDAKGPIADLMPRIAAARLHRWLECFVLSGQEILVDAPHLVTRFPSLLKGSIGEIKDWNQTVKIQSVDGLNRDLIESFEFPRPHWLSRPAWYWPKVREYERIQEVADPWSSAKHERVFCEDSSQFCLREEARSFISDVPSSFSRRYVKKIEDVEYYPSIRFSL